MRILIVEDEKHLAEGLRFNLEADGYDAMIVRDGAEALDVMKTEKFDAVVLDVMMPRVDGFTVARKMREAEDFTPILMLTALGNPSDVLRGFESGADDYLPKPFDLSVFLARLNGLLRRREWILRERKSDDPERETVGTNGRTIDFSNLEIRHGNESVRLTLMEAKLLRYLINNEGRAVSRKTILEEVWGLHEDTDTRAIDNFIVRLRKLIETDPSKPEILLTVRGVGYRFVR